MLEIIRSEEIGKIKERLAARGEGDFDEQLKTVKRILADVRARGDEALFEYTRKFDGFDANAENLAVSEEEFEAAYRQVDAELVEIVRESAANIRAFHELQKRESFFKEEDGKKLGQRIIPLARAGVYVPGGKANYPSSVLMNIIPARVAGVGEIYMATPAGKDGAVAPLTLVAAKEAGADVVYKMGGAQAVAALAYGTQSVKSVDKITGPGNIYVALAKKEVFGKVGIDMIAGPSEVLVIADSSANERYIAADFLSQAEHDELAACVLVTDDEQKAARIREEILSQAALLPKSEIVFESLRNYGTIIVAKDMEDCARVANIIAPEHLELCVRDPFALLPEIKNAGSVFVGQYSPEPLGDYFAGPNHVLPTNGTARFSSPLGVDDFIKRSSVLYYDEEALRAVYKKIEKFAQAEGLCAHARSMTIRFEDGE